MRKNLFKTFLVALLTMVVTGSWAYTPALTADYTVTGYKAKAYYNLCTNEGNICPTEGDFRYRDSNYGLYNFGSGNRGADVTVSVSTGDLLLAEFKDTQGRSVTINSISNCTKNDTYSSGDILAFDVTADATTININVGRAGCILAVFVMEKDASAATADYTINYLFNGTPVKVVSGNVAVGSVIPTEASFFADDVKYFLANNEPANVTIAAEGNVFNINVREAYTYNYSLLSNLGGTITTGTGYEGEKIFAAYPRYQLKENTFYEAPATNKEYRASLTLTEDNLSSTIDYTAKENANVAFYIEGEAIEGMTVSTSGNIPVRASNAVAATAAEDVTITTLAPGKYKLHVGIFTSKSAYAEKSVAIAIGDQTFNAVFTGVNLNEVASEEYVLNAAAEVKYLGTASWEDAQFDYIWIEKTGDVEIIPEPEIIPAYGEIWSGTKTFPLENADFITLSTKYFKDFVKVGDALKVTLQPAAEARAAKRDMKHHGSLAFMAANQTDIIFEKDPVDLEEEEVQFTIDTQAIVDQLNTGENIYLRGRNLTVTKIELLGTPEEEESEVLKEAKELAADNEAVAVGKLLDAIDAFLNDKNEDALSAAINQFKADNADQEKDETAKVAVNGWKKFETNDAAALAPDWAAPAITTFDGRTTQPAEVYESTVETTGQIIYQNISGLTNGSYKVGFYGNAAYTDGRGFDSSVQEGDNDVAYVFANEQKAFVKAHIATSISAYELLEFNVEVTDGTIKLGMGKEKAGTNWHTMQIYRLSWFTTAKNVYAQDKDEMNKVIAEAEALTGENGQAELAAAIAAAKAALQSNKLNIAEFEQEIEALKTAMKAFNNANIIIPEGKYYLLAMELEDNNLMAAGMSQGTQAIVNGKGIDLDFIYNMETGAYNIETNIYNGNNAHYLGSNLFMDSDAFDWFVEEDAVYGHCIYGMFDGVKKYISVGVDGRLALSETAYAWAFIKAEWWENNVKEEGLTAMKSASNDNPVDATFLLKDANFNRNDHRWEAWTVSEDCTNKNLGGGCDGNNGNGCAESWHSTFTISQVITGIPAGVYQLTAQGFYRQDDGAEEDTPFFFANDEKANVPERTGTENDMNAAGNSFSAGSYAIDPITVIVGEEGTLTVGITGTGTHQWVIFDNFRLTYLGQYVEPTFDYGTIWDVETDAAPVAQGDYMTIELNKGYFKIAKKDDIVRVNYTMPDEARANAPMRTIEESEVALLCINGDEAQAVKEVSELVIEDPLVDIILTEDMLAQLQNCDKVVLRYKKINVNKVELIKNINDNIAGMQLKRNDNTIYNLNGQQVKKAQKGLYIVNGKKVMVK